MPIPLQQGLLYGPVDSRRYGRSLGVNPLPDGRKLCSMDCLYCQYGYTRAQESASRAELPSAHALAQAFEQTFARLAAMGDRPDRITVAGNGEPTLHPDFPTWSHALVEARDRYLPAARIGILSNGLHLEKEGVRQALGACYDEVAVKMEWGSSGCFAELTQSPAKGFRRILRGLALLDRFVVQALFVHGPIVDNASPEEIAGWLRKLHGLRDRIEKVEIYSLQRPPAAAGLLGAVDLQRLQGIAARVRELGIPAEAFG